MTGDEAFLHELELDVRAELAPAAAEEGPCDPEDGQRYEVGLRNLLGAVQSVEDDADRS
jgi:hypothetical protein